jgi:hypothetical protein
MDAFRCGDTVNYKCHTKRHSRIVNTRIREVRVQISARRPVILIEVIYGFLSPSRQIPVPYDATALEEP